MSRKFFVYVDYTDDGRPFYVGKGLQERVDFLERNNKHTWVSENLGIQRKVIFCTEDEEQAFTEEKRFIEELKTFSEGNYRCCFEDIRCNHTLGGDGFSGYVPSEETRINMSVSQKKVWADPQKRAIYIAKMNTLEARSTRSAVQKEAQNRPEVKTKQRVVQKEAQNRPKVIEAKSNSMKEFLSDNERRESYYAARNTPEIKLKMSVVQQEAQNRPEVIEANRERSIEMWKDFEYRERTIASMTEVQNRPEVLEANRERSRIMWTDPVKKAKIANAIRAGWARRRERIRLEKLELEQKLELENQQSQQTQHSEC